MGASASASVPSALAPVQLCITAMAFFGAKAAIKPAVNEAIANDVELSNGPSDSISSLAFSPIADYLAVASWDNQVRIYEVGQGINGKAAYSHEGPVLDVCWSKDGSKVLSGGVDNAAKMYDLQSGQTSQIAQHQAPIRCVRWIDMQNGLLVTGSWDKTLKYWDLRSPSPIASVPLEERCYAMDVCGSLLVVGTAERKIQVFNLQNLTVQHGPTVESPLKFQTRSIACFPDQSGYAVGSIEGRVAIQYGRIPLDACAAFVWVLTGAHPMACCTSTAVGAVVQVRRRKSG